MEHSEWGWPQTVPDDRRHDGEVLGFAWQLDGEGDQGVEGQCEVPPCSRGDASESTGPDQGVVSKGVQPMMLQIRRSG